MAEPKTKVAVIVGASSGLGLEFVRQLLIHPAYGRVIGTALNTADRAALSLLPNVEILNVDVTDEREVDRFASAVVALAPHVDLLILSCGILNTDESGMSDFTPAGMMREYQVNAIGPLLVTRALVLRGALGGPLGPSHVAVTSSVLGSTGLVRSIGRARSLSWGFYGYRSSKAAMNMLVALLAAELEPRGVVVVALHPGYVVTDMTRILVDSAGSRGEIDAESSVRGMLTVLHEDREIQGTFLTWEGAELPW